MNYISCIVMSVFRVIFEYVDLETSRIHTVTVKLTFSPVCLMQKCPIYKYLLSTALSRKHCRILIKYVYYYNNTKRILTGQTDISRYMFYCNYFKGAILLNNLGISA